jgi:hypothetical protein
MPMPYAYEVISRVMELVDGVYVPVYEVAAQCNSLREARATLRELREDHEAEHSEVTFHLVKFFSY